MKKQIFLLLSVVIAGLGCPNLLSGMHTDIKNTQIIYNLWANGLYKEKNLLLQIDEIVTALGDFDISGRKVAITITKPHTIKKPLTNKVQTLEKDEAYVLDVTNKLFTIKSMALRLQRLLKIFGRV